MATAAILCHRELQLLPPTSATITAANTSNQAKTRGAQHAWRRKGVQRQCGAPVQGSKHVSDVSILRVVIVIVVGALRTVTNRMT